LAAAGTGAWIHRRLSARSAVERWLAALVPLAAVAVGDRMLAVVADAAYANWNASRLSPALMLLQGHPLYTTLEAGVINEFLYGPVTALAYVPAALASSPAPALFAGAFIALLAFFGPMAWLHRSDPDLRGAAWAASFLCFCLAAFQLGSLSEAGGLIHADAPALGLAACACACLLRRGRGDLDPMLVLAALLAALSVWTKQTLAPVVLALPAYLWLVDGPRRAFRFTLLMGAVGLVVSATFVAVFGFDGLFLNMFAIPSQAGFKSDHLGSPWISVIGSLRRLLAEICWPLAAIALVALLRRSRGEAAPLFERERSWTLLLLVALFEVPTSLSGDAKIGGSANSHAPTTYFALGAASLCLGGAAAGATRAARAALVLVLAGLTASAVAGSAAAGRFDATVDRLRGWRASPFETAAAFARAHPGEAYFPVTPLVSLYAEGALYHHYLGIVDRLVAGYETSPARVRAHVPPRVRFVIFPRDQAAPPFLPGYHRGVRISALPDWNVFAEGGEPLPKPRSRSAR
jgi:hypothetical protein